MGAQTSQQNDPITCPQMFKCWSDSKGEASPYKDKMQQRFFFDIDVRNLLQSNKDKEREGEGKFTISTFQPDSYSNSYPAKIIKKSNAQAQSYDLQQLNGQTCKKQLFTRGNPWKARDSIDTNQQTVRNRIKQSIKENQNIANFDINSKIFENKHSNDKFRQKNQQSPESRLISLDSDFLTLKQNSVHPGLKTPISQSWKHFLSSINRTKFLNSNQGGLKNQSISNQKSNKLINFLNANYIGNTQGSIPNGYGEIRYHNGDMLCGYFQNNVCEGKGKYIKKDGSLYEGDFVHGSACGTGIYLDSDGYRYEGQWRNNQPQGQGKAFYSDLTTYEGSFREGKRHGNGTFLQNGCKFVGEFKNDKLEGTALFFSDNGQTYNGEWKENLKQGFGEYRWSNGDRYVGNYKKGRRQGYGVMYYQNGDTFSGNWRNGMKNGQGIYSTNAGTISGNWIRSKFVGSAYIE